MSTEWTEETIRPHLFTEVEVRNGGGWLIRSLGGFVTHGGEHRIIDSFGARWRHMRLIPKPKKRLMKPIELAGRWLDFGEEGMIMVTEYDKEFLFTRNNKLFIRVLNEDPNCQGWRDTPTSELNTSFEVDDE